MSFFDSFTEAPADPIFKLNGMYKADTRPDKLSFIIGYYLDENLKVPLLKSVAKAEEHLVKQKLPREYLPIEGDKELVTEIGKLVFGSEKEMMGVQTVGGTGALYLAAKVVKQWTEVVAIPDPTWVNHTGIFSLAGFKCETYPYYDRGELHFEEMVKKMRSLPEGSAVLLHTNCHNPSGFDLSHKQWQQLSDLFKKRRLFPLFDMAYQGFSDEPEADAYAPRLFLDEGHEFALTYSCAKNFSLYSERVGALYVVSNNRDKIAALHSQVKRNIRGIYSNPPSHGATIVKRILKSEQLRTEWLEELAQMRKRMEKMRALFADVMQAEFVRKGKGLFCLTNLPYATIERLRSEEAIYIAEDGRINLTGLTEENLKLLSKVL